MKEQIFDLNEESDTHYGGSTGYQISITTFDNKPSNDYKLCWHFDNSPTQENYMKIKLKLKLEQNKNINNGSYTIITLDLTGLIKSSHRVSGIQVYYRKANVKILPIAISIFADPQKKGFGNTEEFIYVYSYREIAGNGSEIKLNNLNLLSQKVPEQKELDEEYRALNTTVLIDINNIGDYKAKFTKNDKKIQDSNICIHVKKSDRVQNSLNFVSYTHSFRGDGFNKIEINQYATDGHVFTEFNGSHYNNNNLDIVIVYFHISDHDRKMPLLIQFKPKIGHKLPGTNEKLVRIYYKLVETEEFQVETNEVKDGVTSNVKICSVYRKKYQKFDFPERTKLSSVLQSIYDKNNVKEKLEKMIPVPEKHVSKNSSSAPGIVIGVLGLVCIPSGVLCYIHHNKIMSTLRLLYDRINDGIYH